MCGHSLFLASASENPGEVIKVSTKPGKKLGHEKCPAFFEAPLISVISNGFHFVPTIVKVV